AAQDSERRAAKRLAQIEKINDTVFDVFAEFDLRKVKQGPDPVEHVLAGKLAEAGRRLDANAIDDPLVLARLRQPLGMTLLGRGRAPEAGELLKASVEVRAAELGPDHPETIISMLNLAVCYQTAGKLDRALPLCEKVLELCKARFGPEHPDTIGVMNNLASGY